MEQVSIQEAWYELRPYKFAFVISNDAKGENASGMIAAWVTRVSMHPALFAVSLSKKGHTHNLVRESKEFALAFPDAELQKEVEFFGSTHGNEVDKFKESGIETFEGIFIRSPLIKKAKVNFECVVVDEFDVGDHYLFIGEVKSAYLNKDRKLLFQTDKIDGKRFFKEF